MENRKRQKSTLGYINKGKFTAIPREDLVSGNKRIKEVMSPLVKDYTKKEALSKIHASKIVLNS